MDDRRGDREEGEDRRRGDREEGEDRREDREGGEDRRIMLVLHLHLCQFLPCLSVGTLFLL